MKLSEIKPGMKVVCKETHAGDDGPGWNPSMDKTIGIELTVESIATSKNYVKCTFDNPGGFRNWWCYDASWLEPYKGLKVGDYVICKEKHTGVVPWIDTMDEMVGKRLLIADHDGHEGSFRCKCGLGEYWFRGSWLEPCKEEENKEVRKRVKRATGENVIVDETMIYGIREIISNPAKRATTVCFNDGRVICVKAGVDVERPDIYSAVTAAIGIHYAGSNNALKNIIRKKTAELKPKKKGPRKEFTIEAGDLVKVTRKGKAFLTSPEFEGGYKGLDMDAELLVTEVDAVCAYVNVASKVKEIEYRVPVDRLHIVRKGN